MGQKPSMCCMGKENPDADAGMSDGRRTRMVEREVNGLRHGVESLHKVVGELQEEMFRLREENAGYVQVNRSLTSENSQLNRTIEEQDAAKAWTQFDIVEEHYKHIERHRRAMDDGEELGHDFCEGDSAGGFPTRAKADVDENGNEDEKSPAARAQKEADKACYLQIRETSRDTEQATPDLKGHQSSPKLSAVAPPGPPSAVLLKEARPKVAHQASVANQEFPEPSLSRSARVQQ